jgi:hypothetical protein
LIAISWQHAVKNWMKANQGQSEIVFLLMLVEALSVQFSLGMLELLK